MEILVPGVESLPQNMGRQWKMVLQKKTELSSRLLIEKGKNDYCLPHLMRKLAPKREIILALAPFHPEEVQGPIWNYMSGGGAGKDRHFPRI